MLSTVVRAYLNEAIIRGEFDANVRLSTAGQNIPVTIKGMLEAQLD